MTTTITDDELRELWLSVGSYPDLLLTGETVDSDGNAYTILALDDASWGSPVPVDVAVQRWMTDGAVAATQGHENREITFKVEVSADTSRDLAAGESALVKRSGKVGTLKWISHEGAPDAPATVFEMWTMHLEHQFDDVAEFDLTRTYQVKVTAKPWARSEDLTVVSPPFVPSGAPVTTNIDTCDVTTGWVGAPNSSVTVASGAVVETFTYPTAINTILAMSRTGTVSGLGAAKYLVVDATVTGGPVLSDGIKARIGSTYLTKVAIVGIQHFFALPAGTTSFSSMGVVALVAVGAGATVKLNVFNVAATDAVGGVGSNKQLTRHLDVGGSVKTSGSIQLASPSATALGTCLIYTTPDAGTGFSSAMRPYRTAGNAVTLDGTCVSGNHEAFVNAGATAGAINYNLPARTPEATYAVVGRFIFGSAATMTVFFTSAVGTMAGNFNSNVTAVAGGVVWAVLGVIPAPWVSLPPESNVGPQFQAAASANTGTHFLDELYLFDITRGSLTLMQGNPGTRLWIDAPDADTVRNRPQLYIGSQADRSDAFTPIHSTILSLGDHDLDSDGMTMFTVTDGVDNAAVTASFYHRWHTHAGD